MAEGTKGGEFGDGVGGVKSDAIIKINYNLSDKQTHLRICVALARPSLIFFLQVNFIFIKHFNLKKQKIK